MAMVELEKRVVLDQFFEEIFYFKEEGLPFFKSLVGGEWVELNGGELTVSSPLTGDAIAKVSKASQEDARMAAANAKKGFESIKETSIEERLGIMGRAAEFLAQRRDDFVGVLMAESGKSLKEAEGEVRNTIERLKLCASEINEMGGKFIQGVSSKPIYGKFAMVIREPLGVVLAVTPFNYPLFISANKVIPALLAGNAVVAKPSSGTPLSLLLFARIMEKAGLPRGALNVIVGEGSEVGDALVSSDDIDMISFTGSSKTGMRIVEMAGIKKLQLELGGKTPAIVLEDADLEMAAEKCVEGALKNSGQRCDAISRILVQESVAEAFLKKVVREVGWMSEGGGIGPLVNEEAVEKVKRLVKDAVVKNAEVVIAGACEGLMCSPTVLDKVPLTADIAWEETFGPVLTIIRFKDFDEAIRIANSSSYGLDASVFTSSLDKAWKAAKELENGAVTINDYPSHGIGIFPYGGIKDSGMGREGLGYTLREMSREKTIVFNFTKTDGRGEKWT